MIEEFEAAQQASALQGIAILLVIILAALFTEFVARRWLRRRLHAANQRAGEVAVNALSGQALLWGTLLGLRAVSRQIIPNAQVADSTTSIIGAMVILSMTIVIIRLMTGWTQLYFEQRNVASISLINNLVRALGVVIFLAIVLGFYGFPITPLLTVIAGSSLGLTLALRDPLANFFSGVQILVSNKIRPGNYVRLGSGEEGYVTDIRWSDTYIRQLSNNMIVVPNAVMTTTMLVNYDQPEPELTVRVAVGVSYSSDLAHVEQVTIDVANAVMREVAGGVATGEAFVRYDNFADSQITFAVIMRGQSFVDQYIIKHEFIKQLHTRYAQEGIVIPFPMRTLHVPEALPLELLDTPAYHQQNRQDHAS